MVRRNLCHDHHPLEASRHWRLCRSGELEPSHRARRKRYGGDRRSFFDGASGTLIVDPPAAPALDLLPLVHAISSFAPSVLAGSPVAALVVGLSEPSMLAAGGHHG
jgi:hypothetical protein